MILIIGPVVLHNIVGQASVIPESCLLSHEFLIDPFIKDFSHHIQPIAGERAAQAHDRIEIGFCRLHNAK